jgi:hypothetical protein
MSWIPCVPGVVALGLILALAPACTSAPFARAPANAVIGFSELKSHAVERSLTWVNVDGSPEALKIIELEIPVPGSVKMDIDEYLHKVYGEKFSPELRQVQPLMIVLHSMAVGTLANGLEKSGFLEDEVDYGISKWGKLPVGSQFIVDLDGTIYCLAPPRNEQGEISYGRGAKFPLKRHAIEANPFAVGIENIVPEQDNWTDLPAAEKARAFSALTAEQIEANARLVRWLVDIQPSITSLFSHDQFTQPEFRSQLELKLLPIPVNPNYHTSNRYDTGPDFLKAVTAKVSSRGGKLKNQP